MTIIEFLLARIAEDEAVARETKNTYDPLDWTEPSAVAVGLSGPCDGPSGHASVVIDPDRLVAESRARRQLINLLGIDALTEPSTRVGEQTSDLHDAATWTLQLLAVPYAAHPDYNQKWLP